MHWNQLLTRADDSLAENRRAAFTAVTMGALLAFLITGQILSPGFTRFWGYLTAQVTIVMLAALAGEVLFRREGGLSWPTHLAAVSCSFADVMGNAAHLYDQFAEYDKVTHFLGCAAVTSCAYDCLGALTAQGRVTLSGQARMSLAIALGIGVGLAWEVYEFLADEVFRTNRVYGYWDTFYDLGFDIIGSVSAGLLRSIFNRGAAPGLAVTLAEQEAVVLAREDSG